METPVSVADVALRAGVSPGTVSNTLNRPHVVAAGTRERVLAAIEELGFVPNGSARHLRQGRTRTIGVVVLDVTNPFFTDVARGAEDAAIAAGLTSILCNSDEDVEKEDLYLRLLEEHRVQGLIITPADSDSPRLRRLYRRGVPMVLLDHRSGAFDHCSVTVDSVEGGRLAMSHLLDLGHRRIAFLGGPVGIRPVRERRAGARTALRDAGVDPDEVEWVAAPSLNLEEGLRFGEELAARPRPDRPTAVFCANDLLALGLLQSLTRHRIAVPDEVALVGYDDIFFARAAPIPLTSVRQPGRLLGKTAADLLIEEATHPDGHKHRHVLFHPKLSIRTSTAGAAAPDDPGTALP